MIALWVLLGLLALAALVLALPVRLELFYDGDGFATAAHLGPIRLPFPGNEKKRRSRKPKRTGESDAQGAAPAAPASDWKRLLRTHWREALAVLGDLARRLKLTRLELAVTAGGEDPAACALAYGRCWAAVGGLLPLIRAAFQVEKEQIQITCDDQLEKTTARGRAVFTLRVFELLQALLALAKLVRRLRTPRQTTKKAVQQP